MPDPTVCDLLLADVDELVDAIGRTLDAVQNVTDQLEPERAASCRVAVAMARPMIDEIKLRAHARPLDEASGDIADQSPAPAGWRRPSVDRSGGGVAFRPG